LEQGRPQKATRRRSSAASPLSQYRLYFLHSVERHITYSHEFEAEDDEHAIRVAESWREGRRAELWTGARKVKSWEAEG
jgi:hypothetical protein